MKGIKMLQKKKQENGKQNGKLSKASLLMVHNPYLKKQCHNKAWGRTQRFEIKVRSIVEMSKSRWQAKTISTYTQVILC